MPQKLQNLALPIPRSPEESRAYQQVRVWAQEVVSIVNSLGANPGLQASGNTGSAAPTLTFTGSNATISHPGCNLYFLTGGTSLSTINAVLGFTGHVTLIPTNSFVINSSGNIIVPGGSITTTADSPVDLHYDGRRWYIGGGLTASNILFNQPLTPDPDGVTAVFSAPSNILAVYRNGARQKPGSANNCIISGNTVTFNAGNIPIAGDNLLSDCLS